MAVSSNPIATGWLNENSLREYPFHEGCGLRPNDSSGAMVSGGWTLPNCLLVDMSVSVDGSDLDPFLYMGQMSVIDGSVTLVFCDRSGNRVMSLYADRESHVKNQSYQIAGTGTFTGARGVACIGDLEEFFSVTPDGMYSFSESETRIEPTCIRPSYAGVRSIVATDASGYSTPRLTGDVQFIAGSNIRFDYDPSGNSITVSADPNAGYSEDCDCESSDTMSVRTINGISVSDVTIEGDDCVEVSEEGGVIKISDKCSKPCCGCAEVSFINQTINDLHASVNTLTGNVSSIGGRLSAFVDSYVLSRKTLQ